MVVADYVARYRNKLEEVRGSVRGIVSQFDDDVAEFVRKRRRIQSFEDLTSVTPCSSGEVESVRASWSGSLPDSVEAFLVVMGHRHKHIDLGVDCRCAAILDGWDAYRDWLDEMEKSDFDWYTPSTYRIPDHALVLGHHGGGYFLFVVDNVPDPKVWQLDEDQRRNPGISLLGLSFSELVLASIGSVSKWAEENLQSVSK